LFTTQTFFVMAGQAKRDPATQRAARLRGGATPDEFRGRADAHPLGGRLEAGHDEKILRATRN